MSAPSGKTEADSGVFKEVAAGTGLGLLVGLVVGLSVSDVVGTVLAALLAGLGAFLGLRSGEAALGSLPLWRLAGFGWFCALGLVSGVYLRAGNVLSPAPGERVQAWEEAGFSPAEARAFVAFEQLGILQEGWVTQNMQRVANRGAGVLFSGEEADRCESLRRGRHRNYAERVNAFQLAGARWSAAVREAEGLDADLGDRILEAAWSVACGDSGS